MLGDQLDRDNDLFSLAAITLDRSLQGCESGFWRARASQNRAALRSEAFFHLGYANKHLGDHQCEWSRWGCRPPGFLLL